MTKTLILMRHAKSDWSHPNLSDHDRPLNARGRKAAPRMAKWLAQHSISADVVFASSAVRVQETIERMRDKWPGLGEVVTEQELYLASQDDLRQWLSRVHDDWASAMFVGHNPGMAGFLGLLSGEMHDFPTAAVAVLEFDGEHWRESARGRAWKLLEYWKPRELPEG